MGNPTTVPFGAMDPIPAGGFIPVAGKFYADTLDTGQKVTLDDGRYTVLETRIEFGSPALAGDSFECEYLRESGADFESYGVGRTVILQAPPSGLEGVMNFCRNPGWEPIYGPHWQ